MSIVSFFRSFARDSRGYVNVEAVIVFPALLFIFGVGWTYFDAFRQQAVNQKANYVISDMISRETEAITPAYLSSARQMLGHLTKSAGTDTDLRVTVVQYNADLGWQVVWSREGGAYPRLENADMPAYADRLPPGLPGDQLVLVETWDVFDPVFNVGLNTFEITTYSFTRPRYSPNILFEGA